MKIIIILSLLYYTNFNAVLTLSERAQNIPSWDNPLFNYELYIYYIVLFKDIQIYIKNSIKEMIIEIFIHYSDIDHSV